MDTIRNYGGETVGTTIHAFEHAGLGKAPFKFVGMSESKFQAAPDAPVQPGTCCDYCSTGIMNVCHIKSADGKTFKVGTDCVMKTGDEGLKKIINAKVAERNRAMSHKRDDAKIDIAKALLPEVKATLEGQEHPYKFTDRVTGKPMTMYDFVVYNFEHAGRAGQVKAAKIVAKAVQL